MTKPQMYKIYAEILNSGTKVYYLPIRILNNNIEGFTSYGGDNWNFKLRLSPPLSWNESDVFKIVDSSVVPNKKEMIEMVLGPD